LTDRPGDPVDDGLTGEAPEGGLSGAAVDAAGAPLAADAPPAAAGLVAASDAGGPAADADADADPPPSPAKGPGLFSLEGRAVPGLYLVGWLCSLIGGGAVFVSIGASGSGNGAGRWLFLGGIVFLSLGFMAATGSQAVERSRREDLAYRGPSPVLAFLTVIAITLLLFVVVLGPLSALGMDASSPAATTLSLVLTALVYLFVIRAFVVGQGALSWHDMGLGQPAGAAVRELLVGMVFAVPVLVVTLAVGLVLSVWLTPPPSPLPPSGDTAGLLLNLLSAAIIAPLGEELFFRGFTTTAWQRVFGARSAIVRGAVFFALAHVATLFDASFGEGAQRAVYSFVALLPVGIALGWLFLARRSLWAPIGLHSAFNALQVLLAFAAASALR
jgi:membrane protease YdiL (CAAX protease family)